MATRDRLTPDLRHPRDLAGASKADLYVLAQIDAADEQELLGNEYLAAVAYDQAIEEHGHGTPEVDAAMAKLVEARVTRRIKQGATDVIISEVHEEGV